MTRSLKGLEDIIQLIMLDALDPVKGWYFSGLYAGPSKDPVSGAKYLRDLYFKASPGYSDRIRVPMLWDKKTRERDVKEFIGKNSPADATQTLS